MGKLYIEFHNLPFSQNTVHVARIGEINNAYKTWSENLNRRDHLENIGVEGRIILKWFLNRVRECLQH
jgi:hypothetical protein